MTDSIRSERRNGWRKLVLNPPGRLNSCNREMHELLSRASDGAAEEDCSALLVTGDGRGFCAGQDLNGWVSKDIDSTDLGQTVRFYGAGRPRAARAG